MGAAELDELIAEITVDCYNEDEQLVAFENAFDEGVSFPRPGSVVGAPVEVTSVASDATRRELIARVRRDERVYDVALLDVKLRDDDEAARLVAAYRRWSGG